jgi:hypothetical protein
MADNFNYFVPLDLSKGKANGGGQTPMQEMIVGGIASTASIDSDGDSIDPYGYDTSRFLRYGFMNWNHLTKSNPAAAIGQPIKATPTKDGLYIEAKLYPYSQTAKDVYELAQVLEKSGSDRKVGFSIEGKVLARDPKNPKRITKALLTGCAITLSPKNTDTYMNILKSEDVERDAVDTDVNGVTHSVLVDARDGSTRYTVDKSFNILKSLDCATAEPVLKESVEGTRTATNKLKKPAKKRKLSKSEVSTLFAPFISNSDDLEKALCLVEQINENHMNVTKRAVEEAFALLGLPFPQADLTKAEGSDEKAPADVFGDEEKAPELSEGEGPEGEEEEEEETTKAPKKKKAAPAAEETTEKSLDGSELLGSLTDLIKGHGEKLEARILEMDQNFTKQNEMLEKSLGDNDTLVKALETANSLNSSLEKSLKELANKVESYGKASAGPRSILTKSHVERFEKSTDAENNLTNISISGNKTKICDILSKEINWHELNKPENDTLAKAVERFELTGNLNADAVARLTKLGYAVTQ